MQPVKTPNPGSCDEDVPELPLDLTGDPLMLCHDSLDLGAWRLSHRRRHTGWCTG